MWNMKGWNECQGQLRWFHQMIIQQQHTIERLQQHLERLESELAELKERKSIHVDTIQYKFDQLKIETLEGQLHIGLSPGQTDAIEDFAVHSSGTSISEVSPMGMEQMKEIEQEAYTMLGQEGTRMIKSCCLRYELSIDADQYGLILNDLKQQLPKRVQWYVQKYPKQAYTAEQLSQMKAEVLSKLKHDITFAIEQYIKQLGGEGEQP